jgi:hypothetical protein
MKQMGALIQAVLLGLSISFLLIGTAAVCYPEETADQVRIGDLERGAVRTADFESRIVRLEDTVGMIRDDASEARIWYRAIGGALILAVLERILRATGILKARGDGLGPVG